MTTHNNDHIMVVLEAVEEKLATMGIEHPGYDVLRSRTEEAFSAMETYDIDDEDDFNDLAAMTLMGL